MGELRLQFSNDFPAFYLTPKAWLMLSTWQPLMSDFQHSPLHLQRDARELIAGQARLWSQRAKGKIEEAAKDKLHLQEQCGRSFALRFEDNRLTRVFFVAIWICMQKFRNCTAFSSYMALSKKICPIHIFCRISMTEISTISIRK